MKSIGQKIKSLAGLLGTKDVAERENISHMRRVCMWHIYEHRSNPNDHRVTARELDQNTWRILASSKTAMGAFAQVQRLTQQKEITHEHQNR